MGHRPQNSIHKEPRRSLSFFSPKRIGRGFTLTELLVAMLIMGFVAAAAITVFYVFIFHFEQTSELTTAQQNGEMVLTILRNPVLHAGLALPASADELSDAFSDDLDGIAEFTEGPLSLCDAVGDGGDVPGGNVLLVLYGIPSDCIAEDSGDITAGSVSITLDSEVGGNLSKTSGETKNWVLFPTAGVPIKVENIVSKTLTLLPVKRGNGTIATYDELYYLRGMRAYARKGRFYTEDLTLQSVQPRVENIAAVSFERNGTLLKAWVVAAGPKEHDAPIYEDWGAFKITFPDWPGSTAFADFSSGKKWQNHRLRVLSESWRVRN